MSSDPGARPRRTPTALDAVAEEYLDAAADLDPIAATQAGLPGREHLLPDLSPQGHAEREQLRVTTLRLAEALDPADDVDRVTLAALRERLTVESERHRSGDDLSELNNVASPLQDVREVFDLASTRTVADVEALAERLAGVPAALAGYRASLAEAVARGWVPPLRQIRAGVEQASQFGAEPGSFTELAAGTATEDGAPLPSALADRLRTAASGAAAGYRELAGWLDTELTGRARPDDAVGPEVYARQVRYHLGTSPDLVETYHWAVDRLAAIESRMAQVAARILGDGAADTGTAAARRRLVDAAVAALDADPARVIEGPERFRDWMQERSDAVVAALAGTHFDIPEPLRALTCRLAPSASGIIYYTGPSEDFTRPGQMWWSVPAGTHRFSTWREVTTIHHEGVPGHHLQIGQTAYRSEVLNRWRRLGIWVSGHGEGWALYAEELMAELGFLDDPGELLGLLDAQALRASRVVVDIGVHCGLPAPAELGGGTWDAAKAWLFLCEHTRIPEANRRFEWERYLGWPGQAISYAVGERVWQELRADARARVEASGEVFDLAAFHHQALELGSVGLDVLRDALA